MGPGNVLCVRCFHLEPESLAGVSCGARHLSVTVAETEDSEHSALVFSFLTCSR